MVHLSEPLSTLPAEDRPLVLSARRDLVIVDGLFQGDRCWIVKDPLAMKYFRLQPPEYLALGMLNGLVSYQDILAAIVQEFPESAFGLESVEHLVGSFHSNGLLVVDAKGQTVPLRKRAGKEYRQKLFSILSSVLAIRFPGFDPNRLLNLLFPSFGWLFSRPGMLVVAAFFVIAFTTTLTNWTAFRNQLPGFSDFFGFDNLLLMSLLLMVTKSIHELGHGLCCKKFGGECHEIGFMLLVMTPAMYCNTSDSWILPNKWHRMAIGAAGMYVELLIASLACFVWWNTQPGWIHFIALNIMFLCSVSTLVFNANPLLRYDGYFLLSDFLEIPNLGQKSNSALLNLVRVAGLGMKPMSRRLLPRKNQLVLACYSLFSFFYRWFVVISICWFLGEVFEPYGLAVVGRILVVISIAGMTGWPLYKLGKFFGYPGRMREMKRPNVLVSLGLTAGLAGFVFLVPTPVWIHAPVVIQPRQAQRLYVTTPGVLSRISVRYGSPVSASSVIAELENDELELEIQELVGKRERLLAEIRATELNRTPLIDSGRKLSELQVELDNVGRMLGIGQLRTASLCFVAAQDGKLIAPPNRVENPVVGNSLQTWYGYPLAEWNTGCWLERGTLIGYVGEEDCVEAQLFVDQGNVASIEPGQVTQILLDEFPKTRLYGVIESVSRDRLMALPREMAQVNGGRVPVQPTPDGSFLPMLPGYQATVRFDSESTNIRTGFRGQARVQVARMTIARRFWTQLQTLLNFR